MQKMAEYIDPRQEVSEDSNINNNALTVEQEQELRARLTKNDKDDD